MSIAVHPEAVSAPQSIESAVSRLGAGFRRMQALGAELATLDAVSQDIRHTQATIRRDVANTVLQTAFSVKTCQDSVRDPAEVQTPSQGSASLGETHVPDQWARKLLRWADQLGRDLFGLPSARARALKENRTLLPPQKR